ncbi:MAG: thiamine phosphate synthase [Clostridiaceae bacterium]|nr:thiamine phosphate synthase [Clostridiaceae bacterium]
MLYLITNRHLVDAEKYYEVIKTLSTLGLKRIILREKDLSSNELEDIYVNIKNIIEDDTKIIINSDIALARRVKAYGLHLSFNDFLKYKKQNLNDSFVLGVSVHSLDEAILVEKLGADYILASNIYETKCKEGLKGKGVVFLREIKEKTSIKVIALGGITSKNINEVLEEKVDGVAIMSTFMESQNIYEDFKNFQSIIDEYSK